MLAQRPVGSLLDAAVTTASKDTSSVTARAMQPSMLTQQQFLQMQQMQQMQQLQQQQPVYYMNASAVGGEAARPSVVAPAQATSPAATAAAMAAAAASIMASRVAAANAASVATLSPDRRSPKAQQLPQQQQQQQLLPNLVGGAGRPVASSGLTNIEDLLATSGFAGLGQGRGGSSGGSNNAKGSLPARKRQRSNGVEVARSPAKERKLLEYPSGEATNELHKLQIQAQQQRRQHQEQLDALAAASATSLHAARSTTTLQAKTQPAMQRQTSSSMSKQQREESTSPPGSPMPGSGLSDLPIDKVSYPFWAPAIRDHLLGGKPLGEKEREQLCAKVVEKLQADLHAAGSSIADLAQRTDPQNGPMHVKREGAKYFPRKNRTSRFVYHSFKDSFEASFAAATYRCCFGRGGSIGLPNFCDLYMPRRGPCLVNHVYETKSHISSMSQQLDQLLAQGMSVKEESSKQ